MKYDRSWRILEKTLEFFWQALIETPNCYSSDFPMFYRDLRHELSDEAKNKTADVIVATIHEIAKKKLF